jgi:ABC-2 type transport system permease protein
MNKVFQIAKWEFFERLKRKYFILSTLLTPIIIIAIGYFAGIDKVSLKESPQIMGVYNLTEIPFFGLKNLFEETKLSDGQPKYILVDLERDVKNNFDDLSILESIVNRGEVSVCLIVNSNNSREIKSKLISKYPKQHVELLLIQSILARANEIKGKIVSNVEIETVTTSEIFNGRSEAEIISRFYESFVLLILLLVTILFSGGLFVRGLAEEKSNRIIEILLSSCKVKEILFGKILGLSLLGLFQIFVWLFIGFLFLGNYIITAGNNFLILQILYFTLGYLFYTSIFVGLGSLVNSEYDSQQLTTNISILLMLPIILALQIIEYPDSTMAVLLSFIPLTSAPVMLLRLNTSVIPDWQLYISIFCLIISTLIFIFITSKVFGRGLLMFDKKLSYFKSIKWLSSEKE